jgi:alpha(1,3/1,4) fucosyltransferase
MTSKPKLSLGFTDYYPTMDDFFMDTLSMVFDIERNDASPDYLIFADETYGTKNLDYNPEHVIKIFFTGENRRPYNGYVCHHAISFDHLDGPQFYRLPLYVLDNWVQTKNGVRDVRWSDADDVKHEDREWFCGFVASNPHGEYRNKIFHMLNEYKQVMSGGALFNNIGGVLPRDVKSKIDFFSKCRFSLCFENSSWPGYVTEKIAHGFIAKTVPIYWGSPTVELDFSQEAMISRHNHESDNEFVDWIIKVDQTPALWESIVNRPCLDDENYSHFKNWALGRFNRWFLQNVYKGVRS